MLGKLVLEEIKLASSDAVVLSETGGGYGGSNGCSRLLITNYYYYYLFTIGAGNVSGDRLINRRGQRI